MMMKAHRASLVLILLVSVILAAVPAGASETGFGPTPFFSSTLNGDFVVGGNYSRIFSGPPPPVPQTDPFTVTLVGIPGGSTVVQAFANWTYLTNGPGDMSEADITINGMMVTGVLSGVGNPDLFWGQTFSASYTADVTALVTGNGNYTIGSAIDDPVTFSYGEGFSLLAVYSNPASPLNQVNVYSGWSSNTSNDPLPATAVYDFAGGPYMGGPAHFFINAADGQVAEDTFSINGMNVGGGLTGGSAADAWQGLLGLSPSENLYDHGEGDVSAFLIVGATSLTATTAFGGGLAQDTIGHSFGAIAFAAPAQVIPEPGTLVLIGVGLAAVLVAWRRKRSGAG